MPSGTRRARRPCVAAVAVHAVCFLPPLALASLQSGIVHPRRRRRALAGARATRGAPLNPRRRRPGHAARCSALPSRRPPIRSGGDPAAPIGLPRVPQPSPSPARSRLPRRRRVGVRAPRVARRPSAAFASPPLCSLRPGPCGPALAVPAHSPRASRGVWRDRAPVAQVDRRHGRRRPSAPLSRLRCGPSPTVPAACGAPQYPRRDCLRAGALRLAKLVAAHLRQGSGGQAYALRPRLRCAHPEAASRPARAARLAPGLTPGAASLPRSFASSLRCRAW